MFYFDVNSLPHMPTRLILLALTLAFLLPQPSSAQQVTSGPLTLSVTNNIKTLVWPRSLLPALETNLLSVGTSPTNLAPANGVAIYTNGYWWGVSNTLPMLFWSLKQGQMSSNALLTANVLNRIAYGPTPDELERVAAIGPQAFIDEQINFQNLPTTIDSYTSQATNGVGLPSTTNWISMTVTGLVTGAPAIGGAGSFYIYLTGVGEAFVDSMSLSLIYSNYTYATNFVVTTNVPPMTNEVITTIATNFYLGTNLIVNGDFEQPFATGWTKTADFTGSDVVGTPVQSGAGSLRIRSTAPGSGSGDAIIQTVAGLTNGHRCVLTFSYLPRANSGTNRINVRLSGSGVISSDGEPLVPPTWIYVKITGVATATPRLYLYLDGAGEVYIDDAFLARGTVAESGTNLLRNGNFEASLDTNNWQFTADFTNSVISTTRSHYGAGSLQLIATAAGAGNGDSVFQDSIFGVTNTGTYTLSFWCSIPSRSRLLTARLSGSATIGLLQGTAPPPDAGSIKRRFDTIRSPSPDTGRFTVGDIGGGQLHDLRSWFVQNAASSPRQLLEVLSQFLENHFVTEHSKSFDYLDQFYDDGTLIDKLAADWEYREMTGWRDALMNTNCTFYDLLKVHAESCAEIVYLDTVNSRGDGNNVANENYGRELLELFCMGVDNGYDQLDITAISRAWTGWSVELVDVSQANNPFASPALTYGFYPGNGTVGKSNVVGIWAFNFKQANHGTNRAPILSAWATNASRTDLTPGGVVPPSKVYAARFGSPWAGTPYRIVLPRRTGTASIQDGYDVIQSLAVNMHTAEYLSVKLCRLFVHDGFPNPTTRTDLPEYAFYNYTSPSRSAEAELVRQCMVAWDTPAADGRKGNIRSVLRTIFNSALFRSHAGSMQKVKTPVEYCVSAIRALRSANPDGTFTSSTDGYSISGRSRDATSSPLVRQGTMKLFDRDAPDGYPEDGSPWISAGTLAERVRFIQTYLMATTDANKGDGITGGNNNLSDPVALLKKKLPSGSWKNAGEVADYFLSSLYPGEGKANLDLYRISAMNFLNTADNGTTPSLFSGLVDTDVTYNTRVRGMVAMLMTLHRFQEQ